MYGSKYTRTLTIQVEKLTLRTLGDCLGVVAWGIHIQNLTLLIFTCNVMLWLKKKPLPTTVLHVFIRGSHAFAMI